jgi:hypothetical protein
MSRVPASWDAYFGSDEFDASDKKVKLIEVGFLRSAHQFVSALMPAEPYGYVTRAG